MNLEEVPRVRVVCAYHTSMSAALVAERPARGPARPYTALGRRLAAARAATPYTQRSLADRVGVSHGYVAAIERGERRPDPSILRPLARALEIDYQELAALAGYTDAERGEVAIYVDPEDAAMMRWFRRLPRPLKGTLRNIARAAFPEQAVEADAEHDADGQDDGRDAADHAEQHGR